MVCTVGAAISPANTPPVVRDPRARAADAPDVSASGSARRRENRKEPGERLSRASRFRGSLMPNIRADRHVALAREVGMKLHHVTEPRPRLQQRQEASCRYGAISTASGSAINSFFSKPPKNRTTPPDVLPGARARQRHGLRHQLSVMDDGAPDRWREQHRK